MLTMPSRRPAGGRRTTALLAALVTLPALVACSAPSEVVPVAAVSARHAAPADLAVTTEGDALVATWAAPPTATSMDVTGYELYVDDAAVVTLDAGTTSHRLAGVRPGDRVYVQVRAVGVDGPGQLAEASTEQVWVTPTARPRSAVVEEAQALAATPTAAPTSAPTPTSVPTAAAAPAPTVTVTSAPTPAPTVTQEVVKEVEVSNEPDWVALYREVENSVVRLWTADCNGDLLGHGTGFFVGADLLMTNDHVVDDACLVAAEIDGTREAAIVLGTDARLDVALLQTVGAHPGRELALSAGLPSVGTPHALIGFGFGEGGVGKSLQAGVIGAVDLTLSPSFTGGLERPGVLQSDVAVEEGSSGGPWLTTDGTVVGVNSGYFETLSFATDAPHARALMERWLQEAQG